MHGHRKTYDILKPRTMNHRPGRGGGAPVDPGALRSRTDAPGESRDVVWEEEVGGKGERMRIRRPWGGGGRCGYSRLLSPAPLSRVPNDRPYGRMTPASPQAPPTRPLTDEESETPLPLTASAGTRPRRGARLSVRRGAAWLGEESAESGEGGAQAQVRGRRGRGASRGWVEDRSER